MGTGNRIVRLSTENDVPLIMQLFEYGRQKMRASGNMEQWADGNPKQALVENDIANGNSYIMEEDGEPVATFAFIEGPDITYARIYEGEWKDVESPYYVIHRMASKHGVRGIFNDVLDFCFFRTNNIRLDTHRQNVIMRTALKKYGFEYCGIIYLLDGAEGLAYQIMN